MQCKPRKRTTSSVARDESLDTARYLTNREKLPPNLPWFRAKVAALKSRQDVLRWAGYRLVIDAAIALLKKGWCKDCLCRDATGQMVPLLSREAVSYSVYGAIDLCNCSVRTLTVNDVVRLNEMLNNFTRSGLVHFNDTEAKDVKDVIGMLQKFRKGL